MAFKRNEIPDATEMLEERATTLAGEGIDRPEPGSRQPGEDIAEIAAEIDSIKASVAHIAEATSHYVRRRFAQNSTDLISENPLRAALWVAFAGFLVGRLTR